MADEDDEDIGGGKKVSGKKLVLFILLPLLVLAGAGAGVYMSGLLDPILNPGASEEHVAEEEAPNEEEAPSGPGVFVPLDEMTVTLRSAGSKARYLKLQLTLELEKAEDEERVRAVMPRIIDNFQVFLRELRVEEMEGSQGIYRIREELLTRVNQAANPVKVKEVLFTDMLIQ
ncbi:flagellar basal body-associated FliL family protein [Marivibrio halodurans]|uniref:Flagellar protein FliL n=1 Tax=Marivibrio halodurans TaxID=2039722 RepID=A0A8J7V2I5_9PROT|nr:flagellar basal body-associated FliL family protein [Marivibrio halodurans]MBP5856947.1 flagellar basal body-associated FliL family protein [Marivibrio halodurans]